MTWKSRKAKGKIRNLWCFFVGKAGFSPAVPQELCPAGADLGPFRIKV
jgi:hypothetical protein